MYGKDSCQRELDIFFQKDFGLWFGKERKWRQGTLRIWKKLELSINGLLPPVGRIRTKWERNRIFVRVRCYVSSTIEGTPGAQESLVLGVFGVHWAPLFLLEERVLLTVSSLSPDV